MKFEESLLPFHSESFVLLFDLRTYRPKHFACRSQWPCSTVGLQPLHCRNSGFESRRGHDGPSLDLTDRHAPGRHIAYTQSHTTQNFINQNPKLSRNSEGTDELPEDGTQLPKYVGAAK
jgi:hypothetical protein